MDDICFCCFGYVSLCNHKEYKYNYCIVHIVVCLVFCLYYSSLLLQEEMLKRVKKKACRTQGEMHAFSSN